jgi:hypothetical protein
MPTASIAVMRSLWIAWCVASPPRKGTRQARFDFINIWDHDHDKEYSMPNVRRLTSAAVLLATTAVLASAQSVTSAHSGTLHYFEGAVTIDNIPVVSKVAKFSEIKENSVLRTAQGRAEVLLTPGVFLRVGENSEVKMLDNRLLSTRIEFVSGSAIVESDDPEVSVKDPAVTILYKSYEIQPLKYGVFEISSEPGQLKMFKGQASVTAADNHTVVKEGHALAFSAALLTEKFDPRQADDLYLWTRDRSAYLSAANMSSARTLASHGYSMDSLFAGNMYPGLGFNSAFRGGWYYNQFMDMFTYMPYNGMGLNPFGYGFFSPGSIYGYYNPNNYYWYGGGGSRTGGSSGAPLATNTALGSQVARLGGVHPTLSSPVRSLAADGSAIGQRGGFNNAGNQTFNNSSFNGGSAGASAGRSIGGGADTSSAGRSSGGGASAAPAAASSSRGR